jgi:hypothetical protein
MITTDVVITLEGVFIGVVIMTMILFLLDFSRRRGR